MHVATADTSDNIGFGSASGEALGDASVRRLSGSGSGPLSRYDKKQYRGLRVLLWKPPVKSEVVF
jgi:hypothetical protein